jgi:hypothetical protein
VSAASNNKHIDKILNPVMHITLELHELSGDSSVVPELTELEGNVVMPRSIKKVRSDSHEILVAQALGFVCRCCSLSLSPEFNRHVVHFGDGVVNPGLLGTLSEEKC